MPKNLKLNVPESTIASSRPITIPGGLAVLKTNDRAAFEARKTELEQAGRAFGRLVSETAKNDNVSVQAFESLTLIQTAFDEQGKAKPHVIIHPRIVVIGGALRDKWLALGGLEWGTPCADERPTGVGDGWSIDVVRRNQNGKIATIIWSSLSGVVFIDGDNRAKWLSLGGVSWGYPVNDPTQTPNSDGWFNHFKGYWRDDQEKSIYWKNNTKSVAVYGTIRDLWASLGWERCFLGWPKEDEYGPYEGNDVHRIQYFDGGTLIWRPADGATVVTSPYQIRFRGFHCSREGSDRGGSSEYFFYVTPIPRVHPDQAQTTLVPDGPRNGGPTGTKYYANVDQNGTFNEDMVVYAGAADSLILRVVAMEQDEGDPDKYKEVLNAITKDSVGRILGALAGLVSGGTGTAIGTEIGDALAGPLADLLNGALGTDNETLATVDIPIDVPSLRQWLANAPMRAPRTRNSIEYHFTTTLSGKGHTLKAYFAITH